MNSLTINTQEIQISLFDTFNKAVESWRLQKQNNSVIKKMIEKNKNINKKIKAIKFKNNVNYDSKELTLTIKNIEKLLVFVDNAIFLLEQTYLPPNSLLKKYLESLKELSESLEDFLDAIDIISDKKLIQSTNNALRGNFSDFLDYE